MDVKIKSFFCYPRNFMLFVSVHLKVQKFMFLFYFVCVFCYIAFICYVVYKLFWMCKSLAIANNSISKSNRKHTIA